MADTLCAVAIVTEQLPVPEQAPPQPLKIQPLAGDAVKLTVAPAAKAALQVEPQLIPAGELVTVPLPVLLTDRIGVCVKFATTLWLDFMFTTQLPLPLQAPPQLENAQPVSGVAYKPTPVP